jgi:hypothetical protein
MMAPTTHQLGTTELPYYRRDEPTFGNWRSTTNTEVFVVEGWGEGFMLGALFIMVLITIVNMRKGVLLHKVIMLEVRGSLTKFFIADSTSYCLR